MFVWVAENALYNPVDAVLQTSPLLM